MDLDESHLLVLKSKILSQLMIEMYELIVELQQTNDKKDILIETQNNQIEIDKITEMLENE